MWWIYLEKNNNGRKVWKMRNIGKKW
jgi:hypothetical protein